MTKTAILTLPLSYNYGGILQAVGLYEAVRRCGHDPVWLDKRAQITSTKALLAKLLGAVPGHNIRALRGKTLATRKHHRFIARMMPARSRAVATTAALQSEVARLGIDTVIVGSDQVWRIDYQGDGRENNYFLDFGGAGLGRISYAASFGRETWAFPERTGEIAPLLKRFDAVSVRERSGRAICRDAFDRADAQVVLDPTLLHDPSFYHAMIARDDAGARTAGTGVLIYTLDHEAEAAAIARQVSARQGGCAITSISLNHKAQPPVTEWLARFAAADFVITDSYHGTIFSIMFGKPFVTLANEKRGLDRFRTLLDTLGLGDRLLHDFSRPADPGRLGEIDYPAVEARLARAREESFAFLKGALARRVADA